MEERCEAQLEQQVPTVGQGAIPVEVPNPSGWEVPQIG